MQLLLPDITSEQKAYIAASAAQSNSELLECMLHNNYCSCNTIYNNMPLMYYAVTAENAASQNELRSHAQKQKEDWSWFKDDHRLSIHNINDSPNTMYMIDKHGFIPPDISKNQANAQRQYPDTSREILLAAIKNNDVVTFKQLLPCILPNEAIRPTLSGETLVYVATQRNPNTFLPVIRTYFEEHNNSDQLWFDACTTESTSNPNAEYNNIMYTFKGPCEETPFQLALRSYHPQSLRLLLNSQNDAALLETPDDAECKPIENCMIYNNTGAAALLYAYSTASPRIDDVLTTCIRANTPAMLRWLILANGVPKKMYDDNTGEAVDGISALWGAYNRLHVNSELRSTLDPSGLESFKEEYQEIYNILSACDKIDKKALLTVEEINNIGPLTAMYTILRTIDNTETDDYSYARTMLLQLSRRQPKTKEEQTLRKYMSHVIPQAASHNDMTRRNADINALRNSLSRNRSLQNINYGNIPQRLLTRKTNFFKNNHPLKK